jgi:hypothetical protein
MPRKNEPLDFSIDSICRYADDATTRLGAGQDEAIDAFNHLIGLMVTSAPGYTGRDSPQRRLLYFASAYVELVQDRDTTDDETAQLQQRTAADAQKLLAHVRQNAGFAKLVKTLGYGSLLG